MASRVIYGARVSLEVGIVGTAIATVIGTVFGLLAGFYRGWVDTGISRIVEVFLAFPVLVLGLGIGAACGVRGCAGGLIQPGIGTVIFIIAISSFTYIARIARGQVLSLREKEFVEAARSLGASNGRILFKELLPNLVAPLIVYASLLIPTNILLEAALSYPGRRDSPAHGQLGADDLRRLELPHPARRLVVHGLPRRRAAAHGARIQSVWAMACLTPLTRAGTRDEYWGRAH